jgi:hypothetical protein
VITGLWLALVASPALSQQNGSQKNLILNGGFEEGFQGEFGVGYGWGAFSNGNAAIGWNADTWAPVVIAGQNAQLIEIKNSTERDRYAGVYQTVAVVPGQQYKLTIKGLIRSEEGNTEQSNYGYRLQYGIDYDGGTAWELVNEQNWQEIQWDEQPLNDPVNGSYRFETFETTLTARSAKLTVFIRAWKKWINSGVGLFDLDEISLVGPASEGLTSSSGQVAAVSDPSDATELELVSPPGPSIQSEHDGEEVAPPPAQPEVVPQATPTPQPPPPAEPQATPVPQPTAQLPVSGADREDTINYIEIMGVVLVLILLTGAITTTIRRRRPV